jgi:hypothetical protein
LIVGSATSTSCATSRASASTTRIRHYAISLVDGRVGRSVCCSLLVFCSTTRTGSVYCRAAAQGLVNENIALCSVSMK